MLGTTAGVDEFEGTTEDAEPAEDAGSAEDAEPAVDAASEDTTAGVAEFEDTTVEAALFSTDTCSCSPGVAAGVVPAAAF